MKKHFLKLPTIKSNRRWDADDVRQMCIDNDYYTCGNNEAYSEMLQFVRTAEPTNNNLFRVAYDIVEHSDFDFVFSDDESDCIANVMFLLENKCVHTSFEIIEK